LQNSEKWNHKVNKMITKILKNKLQR